MTRVDEWSKLLFNNVHLMRAATAIASGDEEFDSGALQAQLMLGQSSVHRVLRVLEGVELVERLHRSSRTQPLRYRRSDHPFWAAAARLTTTAGARR